MSGIPDNFPDNFPDNLEPPERVGDPRQLRFVVSVIRLSGIPDNCIGMTEAPSASATSARFGHTLDPAGSLEDSEGDFDLALVNLGLLGEHLPAGPRQPGSG